MYGQDGGQVIHSPYEGADHSDKSNEQLARIRQNYELTEEEIKESTVELMEERLEKSTNPRHFGLYILGPEWAHIPEAVEKKIFGEAFQNTVDELVAEYGPYENNSRFLTVIDQEEKIPAGMIRVINGSLKTIVDLANATDSSYEEKIKEIGIDPSSTWDIGSLAVSQPYRGGSSGARAAAVLFYSLYKLSLEEGIKYWVAIIEPSALRYMEIIGFQYTKIGEPMEYIGAPGSVPVLVEVDSLADAFKSKSEHNYEVFGQGRSLSLVCDFPPEVAPHD